MLNNKVITILVPICPPIFLLYYLALSRTTITLYPLHPATIYYVICGYVLHNTACRYSYAIASDTVLIFVFLLLLYTYYLHLCIGHFRLFFLAIAIISFTDFLSLSQNPLQIFLFSQSLHAMLYPCSLIVLKYRLSAFYLHPF